MQRANIEKLQQAAHVALEAARKGLSNCDASDIEEILAPVERELQSSKPNTATLATYLNSLVKSIQSEPGMRDVCEQLDEAMRDAHIQSEWQGENG